MRETTHRPGSERARGNALRQVFAVALYRYALDGQTLAGFSADDLQGAVRTK
jgi:hypothetical protein